MTDKRVFAGKYEAERELGEATGGRTWLADGPGGVRVVVKVVHPADHAAAVALERDVSLVAGIRHPVLPTIYEWGHEGSDFFVVREYVPGADLELELAQQGRFAPMSAARYAAYAADALAQIHKRGLLHGNVKTANLIRTPEDTIKLVGNSLGAIGPAAFASGGPASDAYYVAPEQVENGAITPATDVYAMGVVLYELVTGHVPFDGPDAASVADQQAHHPPAPIRAAVPDVPAALEGVIMRALEKAPEARFADGEALRIALDGVLAPAAAPAAAPVTGKRSAWPWVVLGVIVVLAALALAWILGVFGLGGIAVPNVVGMTQTEASATIAAAGLEVGSLTFSGQPVAGVANGSVSSQNPAAGTRVARATGVDLILAGANSVSVPNVVGRTETQATIALQDVGLTAGTVTNVATTSVSAGLVIAQTPPAGSGVDKGSAVDLQIAQTPSAPAVPDVVDQARADAVTTLQNAGFTVVVQRRSSTTVPSGRVIEQSPTGGVTAQTGSQVTIVVSSGPALVTVPDVGGLAQDDAVNALTAAGFKTQITFQSGGGTVGTVVDQSPAEGSDATSGSTVIITVVQ